MILIPYEGFLHQMFYLKRNNWLKVEELKNSGNEALKNGRIDEAVNLYTQAIELDKENHVLYSNRSAAYCKGGQFEKALNDAETTIDLKPDWAKVRIHV